MDRDQRFLQWAAQLGYLTREQALWCLQQRQGSGSRAVEAEPIESFLVRCGLMRSEQIQALVAAVRQAGSGSGSQATPHAPIPPGSGALSHSQDSNRDKMRRALQGSALLQPGQQLGRYVVVEEIARGGMGAVYRAAAEDGGLVALKVMLVEGEPDERELKRFEREIEAQQQLEHPNIVKLLERGRDGARIFYTMELVEGGSLNGLIGDDEVSIEDKVEVMAQVAAAMGFAHGQGIYHRDLKPPNILLSEEGAPKISDFGLAKSILPQSQLTKTGATVGTPSYMAPEQVRGDIAGTDQRCDVWALGVLIFELVTSQRPFQGETLPQLYEAILRGAAPELESLAPEAAGGLSAVVRRCLEPRKEDRYPSAAELAADLVAWLERGEVVVDGQSAPSRIWRRFKARETRVVVPVLALALLIFGGGGGAWGWHWLQARNEALARERAAQAAQQMLDKAPATILLRCQDAAAALDLSDPTSALEPLDAAERLSARIAEVLEELPPADAASLRARPAFGAWQAAELRRVVEAGRMKDQLAQDRGDRVAVRDALEAAAPLVSAADAETAERWRRLRWRLMADLGPQEVALAELTEALEGRAPTPEERELAGRLALDLGDLAAARRWVDDGAPTGLRAELALALGDAEALRAGLDEPEILAVALRARATFAAALPRASDAALASPMDAELALRLGLGLARAGLAEDAAAIAASSASRSAPDLDRPRALGAIAALLRGRRERVASLAREAAQSRPSDALARYELLLCDWLASADANDTAAPAYAALREQARATLEDARIRRSWSTLLVAQQLRAAAEGQEALAQAARASLQALTERFGPEDPAIAEARLFDAALASPADAQRLAERRLADAPCSEAGAFALALAGDAERWPQLEGSALRELDISTALLERARELAARHAQFGQAEDRETSLALYRSARVLAPWRPQPWREALDLLARAQAPEVREIQALAAAARFLFGGEPRTLIAASIAELAAGASLVERSELIERLAEARPDDPQALTLRGALAIQRGRLEEAAAPLGAALELAPRLLLARRLRVSLREARGDADGAKADEAMIQAILDPEGVYLEALCEQAEDLRESDQNERAFEFARQAYAIDPSDPRPHLELAQCRIVAGSGVGEAGEMERQETYRIFCKGYLYDPSYADVQRNPPRVFTTVVNTEAFDARIEAALAAEAPLSDEDLWAYAFGRFVRVEPDTDREALRALHRALDRLIARLPSSVSVRILRGNIRARLGREDALVDLELARRYLPESVWVRVALAAIAARRNDDETALAEARACKAKPYLETYAARFRELDALRASTRWKELK